jgi:uncharacterized membrane protein YgdD (TMEM256/DUF423 family)
MTLSGLFGAIGVAVAAWSTHGLAAIVPADELALAVNRANTANQYLLLHALALQGVAVAQRQAPSVWLNVAGVLFALGMLGFAGGLYGLRILAGIHTGPSVYIVPLGGSCLILGWAALAVAGWRRG